MDPDKLNILLCLRVLLALILIPSFAFGLSIMSGSKGRHISGRPQGKAPGSRKK